MKYTVEERMDIGRRVHEGELRRREAAAKYQISEYTVRDYVGMYRAANNLPLKRNARGIFYKPVTSSTPTQMEDFEKMTKEELILELVKSRIAEARLKKGYEVRGSGADKEYIRLDNKNTK
jgi:transposase